MAKRKPRKGSFDVGVREAIWRAASPDEKQGIEIRFTRSGLQIVGWYAKLAGIEGGEISWERLDSIREQVTNSRSSHEFRD